MPAQTNPQVHGHGGDPRPDAPLQRQTDSCRAPGGMEPTVPPSLGSRSLTLLVPEQVEAGAWG